MFCLDLRVVESGRVFGVVLVMGCYLEDYRDRVGTWSARMSGVQPKAERAVDKQ
jgi:hypothetical protein